MIAQSVDEIEKEVEMAKRYTLPTITCKQCGHKWIPRIPAPGVCPKCHSPYWNRPKIRRRGKKS